jgi:hypothetical protein
MDRDTMHSSLQEQYCTSGTGQCTWVHQQRVKLWGSTGCVKAETGQMLGLRGDVGLYNKMLSNAGAHPFGRICRETKDRLVQAVVGRALDRLPGVVVVVGSTSNVRTRALQGQITQLHCCKQQHRKAAGNKQPQTCGPGCH